MDSLRILRHRVPTDSIYTAGGIMNRLKCKDVVRNALAISEEDCPSNLHLPGHSSVHIPVAATSQRDRICRAACP